MRVALISDKPDHPVLAVMLEELRVRHQVDVICAETEDARAIAAREGRGLAAVYLLKSHTPAGLDLARRLERLGGLVVNGWAATLACQDRVQMARRLQGASLPCPRTWSVPSLGRARRLLPGMHFPLMARWGGEPVILQEFEENDGWDVKMWVVGTRAFAARRPTPLTPGASRETVTITDAELSPAWVAATLQVGREFDLSLYGVDLLVTPHGPSIVDVNAFPGYRGVPDAAAALAAFTEGLSSTEASATA